MNLSYSMDNLIAIKSDGSTVDPVRYGSSKGCTLTAGTWYFVLGGSESPISAETPLAFAHVMWAAAVAGTITIETTGFPAKEGGMGHGADDVTDYADDGWVQENPASAVVPVKGAGNSSTAATVTAGGTTKGEAVINLGNCGARRVRVKLVLTVGGLVRVAANGKGN